MTAIQFHDRPAPATVAPAGWRLAGPLEGWREDAPELLPACSVNPEHTIRTGERYGIEVGGVRIAWSGNCSATAPSRGWTTRSSGRSSPGWCWAGRSRRWTMATDVIYGAMAVAPELKAYLAWIAEEGREFDRDDYLVFLAGRRSVTPSPAPAPPGPDRVEAVR